jgi:hypothetical protein
MKWPLQYPYWLNKPSAFAPSFPSCFDISID